jgi:hypothetical protein
VLPIIRIVHKGGALIGGRLPSGAAGSLGEQDGWAAVVVQAKLLGFNKEEHKTYNTIKPRRRQYRMVDLRPLRSTTPSQPSLP